MSGAPNPDGLTGEEILQLSTGVVAAFVSRNAVPVDALPDLIRSIHQTLEGLTRDGPAIPEERAKPAVPISKSIQQDFIVCLEDGKQLKMLKRYIRSRYGMTPEEYRKRWGLAPDYPMVAPAYAARRSEFAKHIGLGRGVRSKG